MERTADLAVQDIHRAFDIHSSLWFIYPDIPAAVVAAALVVIAK
jgi:hypothetical protein